MNENKLKNILKLSAIEILLGIAIKVTIILCFLQVLKLLLPIEVFSVTSVVLVITAMLLWFFELEGGFVSSWIISNIISARKRVLSKKRIEIKITRSLRI